MDQNSVNVFCENLKLVIQVMSLDELEKIYCISLNISLANNHQTFSIDWPESFKIQISAKVEKKQCHFKIIVVTIISILRV